MKITTYLVSGLVALSLAMIASAPALAESAMHEHRVQSTADEDIALYVRERLAEDAQMDALRGAVLFVHGATYPGITFDTALADGTSWMDRTADAGYAAYYMDVRGYGQSTRPDAMNQPAQDNAPFARAETVVADIDDVVDFIRERTGVDKVNLVGWSWGTVTTGMYTARHADKVDRLVLYAPVYSYDNESWTENLADPDNPGELSAIGAYRTVTKAQADERWASQITADTPEAWRDRNVYDRWYDAMLGMEPASDAKQIKAPNGTLVDIWEIFNSRPVYDAAEISVPTLVIRGDDDPTSTDTDARGLFEALSSSIKRYIVIGEGTHFIALEKHAPQLFAETTLFLNGAD